MNEKLEELVHHFHSEYRKSGISLCISLAAFAVSESWWFYGFNANFKATSFSCQWVLWSLTVITALVILFGSFYIQRQHYFGMRNEARSLYQKFEGNDGKFFHDQATEFFNVADRCVNRICIIAIFNFVFALIYIICFMPSK